MGVRISKSETNICLDLNTIPLIRTSKFFAKICETKIRAYIIKFANAKCTLFIKRLTAAGRGVLRQLFERNFCGRIRAGKRAYAVYYGVFRGLPDRRSWRRSSQTPEAPMTVSLWRQNGTHCRTTCRYMCARTITDYECGRATAWRPRHSLRDRFGVSNFGRCLLFVLNVCGVVYVVRIV